MNRRNFIKAGGIAGLGISIPNTLKLLANDQKSSSGKAQSVIYIYLPGGYAGQETFDPKPLAPVEYRGPIDSIETKIPGERFSKYLPKTAGISDKITVIRSLSLIHI